MRGGRGAHVEGAAAGVKAHVEVATTGAERGLKTLILSSRMAKRSAGEALGRTSKSRQQASRRLAGASQQRQPALDLQPYKIETKRTHHTTTIASTKKMRRREMEKAVLSAAVQRAQAQEDFASSAENRRRGPERELTFAEREDGGEFR